MALVNTLAVRLESITGAFTAGMSKASKDLAGFINQNKSVGQVVRNLNAQLLKTNPILGATAIAATATGGALAAATVIGARYADSINAVSQRTGFATDALSRLKFIAEQTETSFEDLANGLKFLNKNLGEAQAGNKTAAKAFSDLGVKIVDANGAARSSEAVFNDVRSALAGIDNDARRAALGTAVFGRGAFAILPFLRLTTQEIEALGKRAENLGLIVSEDFAKQGDAFGDNLSTIKAAALGLNNIIAQRLLPGINAFLERIIAGAEQALPRFREGFDRAISVFKTILAAIRPVIDAIRAIGTAVGQELVSSFRGFAGGIAPQLLRALQAIASAIGPLVQGIGIALVRAMASFSAATRPIVERIIVQLVDVIVALGRAIQPLAQALLPVFALALRLIAGALELLLRALGPVVSFFLTGFAKGLTVSAFLLTKLNAQVQLAVAQIERLGATITGNRGRVIQLNAEIAGLNERLAQSLPAFIAEREAAANLALAFADVTGGSSSTTDATKKLGKEVAETATKLNALQALVKGLEPTREQLEGGAKAAIDFANSLLEIGSPEAIAQYNALITKLIEMGKAGDDAAARAARALLGAEGPEFPPEEQARREAEFRAAGPQIPAATRAIREEDQRRQQFDVGPEVPPNLERIPNIFGEIILATQEAKAGFASLTNFAGGIGDALAETALGAKNAFANFFKSALKQLLSLIAKALVLKAVMSLIPGLGGFLGAIGFDDPGNDSFAQREGARFGQLFGRGLRSTLGQVAFAGIGANPGTAQVVIEPQIVVQNAGPLARVEWFEKGQQQRLKRREEELGGLSR